jgi:hypothetical protein
MATCSPCSQVSGSSPRKNTLFEVICFIFHNAVANWLSNPTRCASELLYVCVILANNWPVTKWDADPIRFRSILAEILNIPYGAK